MVPIELQRAARATMGPASREPDPRMTYQHTARQGAGLLGARHDECKAPAHETSIGDNPERVIDTAVSEQKGPDWRDSFRGARGRDPKANDERLYLFSLAFPAQYREMDLGNQGPFYYLDGSLKTNLLKATFEAAQDGRDWEHFPDALQRLAVHYGNDDQVIFAQDVLSVFGGGPTRSDTERKGLTGTSALRTAVFSPALQGKVTYKQFYIGDNGLSPTDWIGIDVDGNVHHFAEFMAMSVYTGVVCAYLANAAREWIWRPFRGLSLGPLQGKRFRTEGPLMGDHSDMRMGTLAAHVGGDLMAQGVWAIGSIVRSRFGSALANNTS
jgi:hypothetical protein